MERFLGNGRTQISAVRGAIDAGFSRKLAPRRERSFVRGGAVARCHGGDIFVLRVSTTRHPDPLVTGKSTVQRPAGASCMAGLWCRTAANGRPVLHSHLLKPKLWPRHRQHVRYCMSEVSSPRWAWTCRRPRFYTSTIPAQWNYPKTSNCASGRDTSNDVS